MFIRASVFSVCGIVALGAGLVFFLIVYTPSPNESLDQISANLKLAYDILNMFLSLFPAMVMLIFGTQKDILLRLFFWRKTHSISERDVPPISLTITSPPLDDSYELESTQSMHRLEGTLQASAELPPSEVKKSTVLEGGPLARLAQS
jgi:hypothetical protein